MSGKASKNDGKGAAEEPEPEPGGSLSSTTTASYDPTVFQRPHPDDRGSADGTPRKKGDGKVKSKDKAQGKTKDSKGKAVGRCGNCDAEGAKMKCSQCGTEVYCDEKCQRVRSRVSARGGWRCHGSCARRALTPCTSSPPAPAQEHWKYGGLARPARHTSLRPPPKHSSCGCARRRSRRTDA